MIAEICFGIVGLLLGIVIGSLIVRRKHHLSVMWYEKELEKRQSIIRLYDIWLMSKKGKISMEEYLLNKGFRNVIIYGMDYRGVRLFYELKDSSINVVCGMDRNPSIQLYELEICKPDEKVEKKVDAVIVTAFLAFDSIKKDLEKRGFTNIIAIDELLYELI